MLRREEAQVQLLSFQVNDWPADRVAAGRELPEPLATLALALLRLDAAGNSTRGKADTGYSQADMAQLDQLEPSERQQVFAAVFGSRLAPHVERAWQIGKRGPYSYGGWRRPFRAPEDPSLTLPARTHWLDSLLRVVGVYEPDLAWAAAWAPYLTWYGGDPIGLLCAAAIEEGGAEGSQTYEILCASAQGEHPIGAMGRHVTRALLTANYPPGWDYIERLLLAAQRQEGVRQAILETIDEAHPAAFRRMLRLILDHDLTRFAATVRAADVWLGLNWNVDDIRPVKEALACLLRHLDAAASGEPLPVEGTPQERYLGLWAAAYQNAPAAIPLSEAHLRSTDVEQRFAAVHLLGQLNVEPASRALATALEDPDLRVATWAVAGIWRKAAEPGIFERLEGLLPRFPAKTQPVTAPVWPWLRLEIGQPVIADALTRFLGDRSPERLLPYLPLLDAVGRAQAVRLFVTQKPQGPGTRRALITLAGDGFSYVRQEATRALAESRILPAEAPDLEGLLTRKPADLRASVLGLLLGQPDQAALASGQRLLARRDARQRMAGLDLLRQMVEHRRLATECREVARAYSAARPQLVPAEEERLQILCREEELEVVTLVDGLGLLDPAGRTRPPELRPTRRRGPFRVREAALVTDAAVSCLQSLDAWIHEHRAEPVTVRDHLDKEREELLGNLIWAFPSPNPRLKPEEDLANLPLAEAWEVWWQERPAAARDADGLELVRARACFLREHWDRQAEKTAWLGPLLTTLFGEGITESLRYGGMIVRLLPWFWRRHPAIGTADFLLDCLERSLALIPEDKRTKPDEWRNYNGILGWQDVARTHRDVCSGEWSPAHQARFWRLLRWIDEPAAGCPRRRPQMTELLAAYEAGAATRDDLLDQLIGFREENSRGFHQFTDLHQNSGRQPTDLVERHPIVGELVQRCRERVLEVELKRGDLPTPASLPALALRWTGGMHAVLPLIKALGQDAFARGYLYAGQSRSAVLSHLIRATTPLADNTPEAFALAAQAAGIGPRRLVELAVYAPQWARHVEQTLKWPGFTEAVWWLYAHTKDTGWTVDAELRELWQAQVAQHTGLTGQELMDGAVDVQWFHRAYGTLGAERWGEVYRAALYASGGLGHKRAQLFADAMLGQITREVIFSRVKDKRQGDAVRSLGLLPLPHDGRAEEIQARYAVIQAFLRTSRQFGSQRQASEKLAATIGLENLARTAGYPDPLRLQWAMEARAASDLAAGQGVVTVGEVRVALQFNGDGEADLLVAKAGKPLKAIPAAVKKDPAVKALSERKAEIKRQAVRMRRALEQAMCRGDSFTGEELRELSAHPVLAGQLSGLVLIGERKTGYLTGAAQSLRRHDGIAVPLGVDEAVRIAHPHDLLNRGEWHLWQSECVRAGRSQPFKQIFRELYLLTEAECADGVVSRRYAGHQVQSRQGQALLGTRGWVTHFEEGTSRTFHEQNLTAWLGIANGMWTPAEVEGPTVEGVWFTRRGDRRPLPLEQVPPLVFSETMRDLDLLVSVAHMGGVDPEATASTAEMRAALVRETCAMLKLENVRIQNRHVLVEGQLGSYSIHLGSGIVHRQPGGALCIVPVHAQHRGRLFLPFVDNDPQTAEVLSKVLLLARDREIKDPVILQQILA